MIFFTGDTHASHDIGKLSDERFPEQKSLSRADYVIICGDFGCVWVGTSRDRQRQDWLEMKPFTTLFVDGNHENYEAHAVKQLRRNPIWRMQAGKASFGRGWRRLICLRG